MCLMQRCVKLTVPGRRPPLVSAEQLPDLIHHNQQQPFQLGEFMETFRVAGPGAANVEMDQGLALIEPYSEKLDYYEAQRLDLSEFNAFLGVAPGATACALEWSADEDC